MVYSRKGGVRFALAHNFLETFFMYEPSELIINADGSAFHLHARPGQVAERVILVGDPGRVDLVASRLDRVECEARNREFRLVTGTRGGKRFSCVSTGIGVGNIDIVLTELDALVNIDFGARRDLPGHRRLQLVRIGTCGGLQPDTPEGAFVASSVSVGFDGLLNYYAGRDEVCDAGFERAFVEQTGYSPRLAAPYCVPNSAALLERVAGEDMALGATVSAPGFYGPQGRRLRLALAWPDLNERLRSFSYNGMKINNLEMEGSAVAGMSALLGHDALTVCLVVANRYGHRFIGDYSARMNQLIDLVMNRL